MLGGCYVVVLRKYGIKAVEVVASALVSSIFVGVFLRPDLRVLLRGS